jgi:hypothetical protein
LWTDFTYNMIAREVKFTMECNSMGATILAEDEYVQHNRIPIAAMAGRSFKGKCAAANASELSKTAHSGPTCATSPLYRSHRNTDSSTIGATRTTETAMPSMRSPPSWIDGTTS